MRMLVLCPLVPSVLWPLPALRMLPMLPSLPTLFLSPAARGRRGGRQQRPRPGADTGHGGPQQRPVCRHSAASKNQPPTRSPGRRQGGSPKLRQSLPPPSAQRRQGDPGWQGTCEGMRGRGLAEDTGREKAALWAPLNSLSLRLLPLAWLFPHQEGEGDSPAVSPCTGRAGTRSRSPVPSPSPSPAAALT